MGKDWERNKYLNRGRKETGHPSSDPVKFFLCFVAIVFLGCAVLTPLLSLLSVNRGFCPAYFLKEQFCILYNSVT